MRPSRKFLKLIAVWLALAVPLAVLRYLDQVDTAESFSSLWWMVGISVAFFSFIDLYRGTRFKAITASRKLPATLAVGIHQPVDITVTNPLDFPVKTTVTDHWPEEIEMTKMPVDLEIPADNRAEIRYQLKATRRGQLESGLVDMRVRSKSGFWDFRLLLGEPSKARVYPNFAPIFNAETLSLDQQINRLGAHQLQQRGSGMDFHQLREFRQGDVLRQVDWKASSRLQRLISREYQFERDQDIIFLMDCGRRMRARDEGLSHFDHALNAMLLTSWIALRQGDAVGFQSFANGTQQEQRWLAPAKGQITVNRILQQAYDLHSTTTNSDFVEAAEQLITHHRKRALVVLVTNIREEDREDLRAATRLLAGKHIVMVASLREQVLDQMVKQPVEGFEQALHYAGTQHYLDERKRLLRELRNSGVLVVDALPETLHVDMVTQYLQLKSSGRF
ncbi:DUF58 domain-containing protein [Parendozoicomonas sp. Alg238-R29]|uniref:DUF58 domain-containing protein n=1 Tax=Parendozoicomonas sp. Alg238-R29 TaxID=2993446 RepID=UPI00248DC313|nr:DUF58 domain-containing protein [Parendozoicomonas sp. Alg238-R29]